MANSPLAFVTILKKTQAQHNEKATQKIHQHEERVFFTLRVPSDKL